MVFALVLLAVLLVSLAYNLSHMASGVFTGSRTHGFSSGPTLEEVTVEYNRASAKVAVIRVEGMISGDTMEGGHSMVDVIKAQLERADEDPRVKAVVLRVDSPGGEVLAADEIHRLIERFQDESTKPVVASMGSLAASGGYYVSAPCRWIVANELTLTGSIGVIMQTFNFRGLMDKVGLKPVVYKSGKHKDMLSGMRPPGEISPEEDKMMQSLIQEVYEKFQQVIATGRNKAFEANKSGKQKSKPLAQDWKEFADGRVFSGNEALRLGFVDELGNFEDAVNRAKGLAGLEQANLIEYRQHYDLSDLLRMFGKSDARGIRVDVGVDLPKLRAGQLYFLSTTVAH